jgi:N-acetylneuraminic acid mutarotase
MRRVLVAYLQRSSSRWAQAQPQMINGARRTINSSLLAMVGLVLLSSQPATAQWTPVAPMNTARRALGAARVPNGLIYAVGGLDATTPNPSPLNTVEVYSTVSNTWAPIPPMSIARGSLGVAAGTDGRVYAIGGQSSGPPACPPASGCLLSTVEAYSPDTNTWTMLAPMSINRVGSGAVTGPDGRIYVFGGQSGADGSIIANTVEAYSPGTNTWTILAPMPTARANLAAAIGNDGRIYVIGGFNNVFLNTVEAYSPVTNTWSTVAPMPTARHSLAAATGPDGRIYAMGGASGPGVLINTVEAYSPDTDTWSSVAPLSMPRYQPGAATGPDGRIYAIGGHTGVTALSTVEALGIAVPVGTPGPPGPAGPAGPIGPTGPIGPAGSVGPAGLTGATGAAGPAGPAGPIGPTGFVGPAGLTGATGAVGPAGPAGPVGSKGPAGPAGPIGATGAVGHVGPIGPVGPTGPRGPAGSQIWNAYVLDFTNARTVAAFTPDTAITVTRIQAQLELAPAPCSAAVLEISDGTTTGSMNLTGGSNDSGARSLSYLAKQRITLKVSSSPCQFGANIVVQYKPAQ